MMEIFYIGVKQMADKAIVPLQAYTVDTDLEKNFVKVFLLLRDMFVLSTLLFFALRLDSYLFRAGSLPVAPIVLMAAWMIWIWTLSAISTMFERGYSLVFTRAMPIILPFIAIMGVSWVGIFLEGAYLDDNYKSVLMPTLDFGIFLTGIIIGAMRISKRKWSLALALGLCCILGTVFIDVINPGTFSRLDYRASGLYEQPNIAAFTMVLFLTAILRWEKKSLNLTDMIFATACGIGVFFTFSRGGVVEFLLIACLYWYNLRNKERSYFIIKGLVFLIFLGGIIVFLMPDYISRLEILQFKSTRLDWFTGDVGGAVSISDSRVKILDEYLPLIAASPVLGNGSGYINSMWLGPHNIYIAMWVENGIVGLLSYIWLLVALLVVNKRMNNYCGVAMIILIMAYGFLTHNLLDERPFLLLTSILTTRAISAEIMGAEKNETERG
ncbi:MAG: hypothetical protein H6Q66_336 [Firmicutes bacterium]|nr:hypothetical protein [Bacillota bacterium]